MIILSNLNRTALFRNALLITLALRLLLAGILPLSGDEAYFVLWARHLDFGYYDHPPMVGWFLHLMLYLGHSELVLRLPAVLTTALIGMGIYHLLKPQDKDKAALVATLFLVSPISVLNVLVTTDTPLLLFAFLSMAALYRALQQQRTSCYIWSGVFLGLAFLSKYFAVLLVVAYLAYWLLSAKSRNRNIGFALLFAASIPFVLVNLYWNYTHCWDNILFNLYTRNEDAHFSPANMAIYAGILLYLITPPVLWLIIKHRTGLIARLKSQNMLMLLFVFIVPLAVFALLAMKKVIGLHWVLAFFPALYMMLFAWLTKSELQKLLKFMLGFTALHLLLISVLAALPLETWKHNRLYGGMVFMFEHEKVVEQLHPYEENFLFATDGYSPSATIEYYYGKPFFVFGEGGLHARQDDMLTDFSRFNLRDILILSKSAPDLNNYTPYFARIETRSFTIRDATFHLVLGYGFNFEKYRQQVLRSIRDKYYRIPSFLPHAPCYFCEKYFINQCDTPVK
jgi:hypothetical protein